MRTTYIHVLRPARPNINALMLSKIAPGNFVERSHRVGRGKMKNGAPDRIMTKRENRAGNPMRTPHFHVLRPAGPNIETYSMLFKSLRAI